MLEPEHTTKENMVELIMSCPLLVTFLVLLISFLKFKRNRSKKILAAAAPEPAGAWLIIGHLFQLVGPKPICRTLGAMADRYGPAFVIRFGTHPTFVVSSWEMAKECFVTNDKKLPSRPKSIMGKHMTYNYAMIAFAPYGTYWREVRKMASLELLSNRRLEELSHIHYGEICLSIKELYDVCKESPSKVDMKRWFGGVTMNVVLRMVAGKRYVNNFGANGIEGGKFLEMINRVFELANRPVLTDWIPFLSWLDFTERARKRTAKEMDVIMEQWLDEHRQRKRKLQSEFGKSKDPQDFMDIIISIVDAHEEQTFHGFEKDTVIKATSMNLIMAATDTTAVTLTWVLSLLLNHPTILKKAQEELDIHVGRDRQVVESDIDNLVFLRAIVKETLRLYPAGPLSLPHEATEDCEIGGYQVKAGTQVIVNLWKLHRDPRVWSDPLEFKPERFFTDTHKDMDVRGQHLELIPFGVGRRSCPGMSLALLDLHYTLACLLHAFELEIPTDCSNKAGGDHVDTTEGTGLTLPKLTPLHVLVSPRLPNFASIYGN